MLNALNSEGADREKQAGKQISVFKIRIEREAKKEKEKKNERGSSFSRDWTNPFRNKWEDIAAPRRVLLRIWLETA